MTRNALTWTYRIAAGAAIACAPFGAVHAGFAVAGLVLAIPAGLIYAHLHPERVKYVGNGRVAAGMPPTPPGGPIVNPATGLPMNGMFDTGGNPYGGGIRKMRSFHDH